MMQLLRTLFVVYFCLKLSKAKSLRSNRFVDFTIQCRQLSDFTWECACPERNVIMTLSNSEDEFLVCGVDFRLSILSKTPRFVPQQQQLASNFDEMVEHETPNKLFRAKNDYLQSNYYKDKDYRDFRDQEKNLHIDGEQNGMLGKEDSFQNAQNDDEISQSGRFPEDVLGNFKSKKRINDPDDFDRNRQFSDYRSKHDYIKGFENDNGRPYASNYVTTNSDAIISEEKLDQNLKKVFSGNMNNLDDPYENKRPENLDIINENNGEKVNYQIDKNHDERNNRNFVSAPIQPRYTKELVTTVRPTTKSPDSTSTARPIESVLGNEVPSVKLFDSQATRAPEIVQSTVKTQFGSEINSNAFDVNPVSSYGDVITSKSTKMAVQSSSASTKEMNIMNKLYETTTISKDSNEKVSDKNVDTSNENDTINNNTEVNGCHYSEKMLSVGESFPISNACKLVCIGHNSIKTDCSGNSNSKKDHETELANSIPNGDYDRSDKESTDKKDHQEANLNKTAAALISTSKDEANSSYFNQGGIQASNKIPSGKNPKQGDNILLSNLNTRNEKQSVPSTGSTDKQCTAENGCYFSGKILCIGDSIPLSYSCKMVCVNINAMKRDCSAKTLENYNSDPNFSFSKWVP